MEPIKIKLSKPIKLGDQSIDELTIERELVAGDLAEIKLLKFSEITVGEALTVMGSLCGQPPSVMKRLAPADLPQISETLSSFF